MINFRPTFPWIAFGGSEKVRSREISREPLREFVYLDEVSLASLLASQTGELTENITAASGEELVSEAAGKIGVTGPLLPSAEVSSRFQTTNSSTLQTVRKATAQSLFRELHKLDYLRRIQPVDTASVPGVASDLFDDVSSNLAFKASDLRRGDLVEFRVKLSASWIFQMSTMVAEFSDMFDESPALFVGHIRFADLWDAKNANKIVSKLLAGLVPIDGLVSDYSVVEHDGDEFVVHAKAISELKLESKPLQIVGVTEHLAYWKDIRRILFANNEFTMLCRISKSGIQDGWNPIKLADIFKDFAPDLANQIEASSKMAMLKSLEQPAQDAIDPNSMRFMTALMRYRELLLCKIPSDLSEDQTREIDRLISELPVNAVTAEGQRSGFSLVKEVIQSVTQQTISPDEDLQVREQVREELSLPLFPITTKPESDFDAQTLPLKANSSRLLDVEVVAIYW